MSDKFLILFFLERHMKKHVYVFCLLFVLSGAFELKANITRNDTVICPLDGEKIIFKITTGLNTWGSYTDMEKTGIMGDYYKEIINTCPKCHFSGYIEDFRRSYKEEVLKNLIEFVAKFKDRSMDEVSQCEMAGEILAVQNADNRDIAYAYLVASYQLRMQDSLKEKRKNLQRKVIEHYNQAIQMKEYDEKEKASYLFLIGDMYRRVGDFEMALKYYQGATAEKKKHKWVKNAIELMKPLAEKKDDNNKI